MKTGRRKRKTLFVKENEEQMCFIVPPGPMRTELHPLIEANMGAVVSKYTRSNDAVWLVPKDDMSSLAHVPRDAIVYYSDYITACIDANEVPDPSDFKVRDDTESGEISKSGRPRSEYRSSFVDSLQETRKENLFILNFISAFKRHHEVTGSKLWEDLVKAIRKENPRTVHSWECLQKRFLDWIYPFLNEYELTEDDEDEFRCGYTIACEVRTFTNHEDQNMLNYIVRNDLAFVANGEAVWKSMERLGVLNRHWRCMKIRFFQHVIPQISSYSVDDADVLLTLPGLSNLTKKYLRNLSDEQYLFEHGGIPSEDEVEQKMKRKSRARKNKMSSKNGGDENRTNCDKSKKFSGKKQMSNSIDQEESNTSSGEKERQSSVNRLYLKRKQIEDKEDLSNGARKVIEQVILD